MPRSRGGLTRRRRIVPPGQTEPSFVSPPANIDFTEDVPATYSLIPHTSGFIPGTHQFAKTAGTFGTGRSLDPDDGFVFDGSASPGDNADIEISIVDTPKADFLARQASLVDGYGTDWSEYASAADAYAGNACYLANKNPSMGSAFTNAFELVSTSGEKTGGKCLRLYHGKATSSGEIDNQYWAILHKGGKDTSAAAASFATVWYVQLVIWTGDLFNYLWKKSVAEGGDVVSPKAFIVDYDAGTATQGEVVVDNQGNQGVVSAYRHTGGQTAWMFDRNVSTPNNENDFRWQSAIDRGTPAITTQASYLRRHGMVYSSQVAGLNQASLLHLQGVPHPDAAIGGIMWNRNGLTVVEVMLDLPNDRCKVWAAPYGQAPTLTHDSIFHSLGVASFGSRVKPLGTGWNTTYLSNLVFRADVANNPGAQIGENAWYHGYAEFLAGKAPIKFPGGFALP